MQLSEIKLHHRETMVDLTYQTILNRPVDPEGKQTFLNRLIQDEMLISIISDFINSEEYKFLSSLRQSMHLSPAAVPNLLELAKPTAAEPAAKAIREALYDLLHKKNPDKCI
jgi:hypothetical protein